MNPADKITSSDIVIANTEYNSYDFLLPNGEIDTSWMSRSEKKFLEVLSDESNRKKSSNDLIQIAGYKFLSSWYRVLDNTRYTRVLDYLGIDVEYINNFHTINKKISQSKIFDFDLSDIENIDTTWMTSAQRNIYSVLKDKNNRTKTIKDITRLAGYKSKNSWYLAIENESFRCIIKGFGINIDTMQKRYSGNDEIDFSKLDSFDVSWMTPFQKKIFELLKDTNNHNKTIGDLVSLSGYTSPCTIDRARRSERFRNLLSKFNVQLNPIPQFRKVITDDQLAKLSATYTDINPDNLSNVNTDWMSRSQKKFYKVLLKDNNKNKPIKELVQLSGYKNIESWRYAVSSEKFLYLLTLMKVDVSRYFKESNILTGSFNIDTMDISWMTKPQKNFFNLLRDKSNISLSIKDITSLAGYKSEDSWYRAIKSEQFSKLLILMGVNLQRRTNNYESHDKITYIINPLERSSYLEKDVWDIRRLSQEYPLHCKASRFIINFMIIENSSIREIIKQYFKSMLVTWKPLTFRHNLKVISHFANSLHSEFSNIKSFKELKRTIHIEKTLQNMYALHSSPLINACLNTTRSMFKYMYNNKWADGPETDTLIIDYDIPTYYRVLPKPIPLFIKYKLDNYLESIIIPLLESNKPTPFVDPFFWDMIIILRYTGRRYEDVAHLIADDTSNDCLRYDLDGDPQLFTSHRIAKINKDIIVPISHIKDSEGNNIVERAILRQKKRVFNLAPSTVDSCKYLFRRIKVENLGYAPNTPLHDTNGVPIIETINHDFFSNSVLDKICRSIPLTNENNEIYYITPHQFRHTVATEMIDVGIDIYAVKEFLGHSSVTMTERYIKVYQKTLKKSIIEKLQKSDATAIKGDLSEENVAYDSKWVKNKIVGVFELGDGCCEHPYKMSSCPHMAICKICFKRKVRPDHKERIIETIDSFTINRDQFNKFGLIERAEECSKIIKFYSIALDVISSGSIFDPKIHLPQHFYTS